MLVERDKRKTIKDVKVSRSAEIDSDHYLLIAKLKGNICEEANKETEITRKIMTETIRTYKLKNKSIAIRFANRIDEEIEENIDKTTTRNIEEIWTFFKEISIKVAREVCGTCRTNYHKKQTAWWNNDIREHIKLKKKKWKKYLNNRTADNYEEYKKQRRIVKDVVAAEKRKSWEEFGKKIEEQSNGNQKLFYKVLKSIRKGKDKQTTTLKNADGEILTDEKAIMKRWKEYFQDLLEGTEHIDEHKRTREVSENIQDNEEEITMLDMEEAISKLKMGKAPGQDKITSEMIKNLGPKGRELLLEIYKKVSKEERIPKDWEVGLILPIFKKGDKRECKNYRGITLTSTVLKVYEHILEKKLREIAEPTLKEAQSGFRKSRSVQDHIFTLKEIITKTLEKKRTAHFAFIDLEKAFDTVPRTKIWESLHTRRVSSKMIRIIQSLYKNTVNCVISKNSISDKFTTNEGLRQGGVMSPLLFIIFMDDIITKCNEIINKKLHVGYKNLKKVEISECAFADDIVIITETAKDLEKQIKIWNETLKENGMKINKDKTKVMTIGESRQKLKIKVDEEELEQVNQYQYLGVMIEQTGKQEMEINERIDKAAKMYYALNKSIIGKKEVSRKTKMNVYKVIFRPILTYGSESWILNNRQKSKLQAMDMKYLRKVKGVTRRDRIRNEDVRTELQIQSVLEFIENKQLSWWGHLQRMTDTRPAKEIWGARVQSKKGRGRPKETWNKVVEKILRKRGKTWTEAKRLSRNRKEWRQFVHNIL